MICLLELERESPNTELQPKGWLIADNYNEAIKACRSVGEFAAAEQLCIYAVVNKIMRGKYLLDAKRNLWLLVN